MRIANWLGRSIRALADSTVDNSVAAARAAHKSTTQALSDFKLGLKGVDVTQKRIAKKGA